MRNDKKSKRKVKFYGKFDLVHHNDPMQCITHRNWNLRMEQEKTYVVLVWKSCLRGRDFRYYCLQSCQWNYVDRILYYLLDGGICRDLEFYSSIGPDHSGLCNWDSGTGSRI